MMKFYRAFIARAFPAEMAVAAPDRAHWAYGEYFG